jgi:hypothetical protein
MEIANNHRPLDRGKSVLLKRCCTNFVSNDFLTLVSTNLLNIRENGFFGTNFDFDARLRRYSVLECIATKWGLVNLDLIHILPSMLVHIFAVHLFLIQETSNFWISAFAGNLGQQRFLDELKDFGGRFFNLNI